MNTRHNLRGAKDIPKQSANSVGFRKQKVAVSEVRLAPKKSVGGEQYLGAEQINK